MHMLILLILSYKRNIAKEMIKKDMHFENKI